MTTFNTIDTAVFQRFHEAWLAVGGQPISDGAQGAALAMPSVSEGGVRAMRGGLKAPGLTSWYVAIMLDGGVNDLLFYDMQRKLGGAPSNKTNNVRWLSQAGLLAAGASGKGFTRVDGVRHAALTDKGFEQLKAVGGNELVKAARGFSEKGLERHLAGKPRVNPPKAKGDAPAPVEAPVDADMPVIEPTPVNDGVPGFTG